MRLTIDDREVDILPSDATIIDVADRARIHIPDPCHRTGKTYGCCRCGVVEIEGDQKFACSTKPEAGMNVTVSRDDLKDLRGKRLEEYAAKRAMPKSCCGGDDAGCCS